MTIQKAIEVLEYARNYDGMDYGAPSIALDMAISALRQQDVADKDVWKMTNADRIRSISDEELADFLNQWGTSTRAWQKDHGETLYWLQQTAGEEDKHENLD